MYSVVLVDDQVLFVESLRSVIESRSDDFSVVGVYYDGTEAAREIGATQPDLVLMDVRMPGTDGVQATRRLLSKNPSLRVLMLTTYDEDAYLQQAIRLGAVGYLLKDMPPDELIACMRSAVNGHFQMPSKLAQRFLVRRQQDSPDAEPDPDRQVLPAHDQEPPDWLFELSRKERTILRLVIEGFDNEEIAQRVFLAPQTVKNYISKLYSKTETDSRSHLIRAGRNAVAYL